MENSHKKTDDISYHAYPIKHTVNINMDIFPIHNIDTRK